MALFDNMVAWYRGFDNTNSTGSGDPILVYYGGTTNSQVGDNKCGSYFDFQSQGDGFKIGDPDSPFYPILPQQYSAIPIDTDDGFTLTTWFYNLYTGSSDTFFFNSTHPGNTYQFMKVRGSDGHLLFIQECFGAKTISTNYPLRDYVTEDTWHHLALTVTSSVVRYYLDGVEVATASFWPGCSSFTIPSDADQYINGGDPSSVNNPTFERLTDIGIWQRALDGAEVAQIAAKCIADTGSAPQPTIPIGRGPYWQTREERNEILNKKANFKLKKLNGKTTLDGIESSDLLETPKFERVVLDSDSITSNQDGEMVRNTHVTLKMSLGIRELLSSGENLEDYIKVVIMQSNKGRSSNEATRIYENFIRETQFYRKEGDKIFFEIPTTLKNKLPSELSFYAFAYFDLSSLITSDGSSPGLESYIGDIMK